MIGYSPLVYRGLQIFGAALFVVLMVIAWTSDTAEVGLELGFKLEITAAALVLGGGLVAYAHKYRRDAEEEAELAEQVRRELEQRRR